MGVHAIVDECRGSAYESANCGAQSIEITRLVEPWIGGARYELSGVCAGIAADEDHSFGLSRSQLDEAGIQLHPTNAGHHEFADARVEAFAGAKSFERFDAV